MVGIDFLSVYYVTFSATNFHHIQVVLPFSIPTFRIRILWILLIALSIIFVFLSDFHGDSLFNGWLRSGRRGPSAPGLDGHVEGVRRAEFRAEGLTPLLASDSRLDVMVK